MQTCPAPEPKEGRVSAPSLRVTLTLLPAGGCQLATPEPQAGSFQAGGVSGLACHTEQPYVISLHVTTAWS